MFVRFPGAEMVLLLLKDMADLKPNVGVREGTRRV